MSHYHILLTYTCVVPQVSPLALINSSCATNCASWSFPVFAYFWNSVFFCLFDFSYAFNKRFVLIWSPSLHLGTSLFTKHDSKSIFVMNTFIIYHSLLGRNGNSSPGFFNYSVFSCFLFYFVRLCLLCSCLFPSAVLPPVACSLCVYIVSVFFLSLVRVPVLLVSFVSSLVWFPLFSAMIKTPLYSNSQLLLSYMWLLCFSNGFLVKLSAVCRHSTGSSICKTFAWASESLENLCSRLI